MKEKTANCSSGTFIIVKIVFINLLHDETKQMSIDKFKFESIVFTYSPGEKHLFG